MRREMERREKTRRDGESGRNDARALACTYSYVHGRFYFTPQYTILHRLSSTHHTPYTTTHGRMGSLLLFPSLPFSSLLAPSLPFSSLLFPTYVSIYLAASSRLVTTTREPCRLNEIWVTSCSERVSSGTSTWHSTTRSLKSFWRLSRRFPRYLRKKEGSRGRGRGRRSEGDGDGDGEKDGDGDGEREGNGESRALLPRTQQPQHTLTHAMIHNSQPRGKVRY
jgi:hypothetical protein